MQRRNHSEKVRANDEGDDRDQILFSTGSIEEHRCDDDGGHFKRDTDPVNRSVESAAVFAERSAERVHDDCRRNQE